MNTVPSAPNDLLTPAEVAALLAVGPKTVRRWAMTGKINSIRTPGGHRRFLRSEIVSLMVGGGLVPPSAQQPVIVRAPAPPAVKPVVEPERPEAGHFGRLVAGMVAEAVMDAVREESGRSDPLVAGLVAEAVVLAARAAQADRATADPVAASDAVVAAARRTAAAARRLHEERAQAAEQAAEAIANNASRAVSDLEVRADATARHLTQGALAAAALIISASHGDPEDSVAKAAAMAFTLSVSDVGIEGEAAAVAAALQVAATARPAEEATETDTSARATTDQAVARSG